MWDIAEHLQLHSVALQCQGSLPQIALDDKVIFAVHRGDAFDSEPSVSIWSTACKDWGSAWFYKAARWQLSPDECSLAVVDESGSNIALVRLS